MSDIALTDTTFQQDVIKSDVPVLVDFWAEWCQPCKMVSPVLDELGEEYKGKIKVAKMNVDENTQVPSAFGIMSIPTIIIFKGGKPLKTLIGVQGKDTFKKAVEEVIASA